MGRGRGRGKGKKLTVVSSQEDLGSGGEAVLPAYKRRGRPQKPMKDEIDDEGMEEIQDKDEENINSTILIKEVKTPAAVENGRKRKKNAQVKENMDSVKEETGVGTRSSAEIIKSNGFRQNASRRKSTPRRAAEAGVECNHVGSMVDPCAVISRLGSYVQRFSSSHCSSKHIRFVPSAIQGLMLIRIVNYGSTYEIFEELANLNFLFDRSHRTMFYAFLWMTFGMDIADRFCQLGMKNPGPIRPLLVGLVVVAAAAVHIVYFFVCIRAVYASLKC